MYQSKCLLLMLVFLGIIIFFTSLASSNLNIAKEALDKRDIQIQDGSSYLNGVTPKDVEM